jgi:hypothetical protein
LIRDWPRVTGAEPNPWEQAFIEAAPAEVHDWLLGLGLRFQGLDRETGTNKPRIHHPVGGSPELVRVLLAALRAPVETGTWVTGIEAAPGGGFEVSFRKEKGKTSRVHAGKIVLATGSLFSNEARAKAYAEANPCAMKALVVGKDGPLPADADAPSLLASLRPAVAETHVLGLYPHVAATGGFPFVDVGETAWVDGEGRRFYDERQWFSVASGLAVSHLEGCEAWSVFPESRAGRVLRTLDAKRVEDLLAEGRVLFRRDTAGELAEAIGVNPENLGASLKGAGPFYALRLALTAGKSFTGLQADLAGRVLDVEGRAIPGLYAAGELVGMGGSGVGQPEGFDGSLSAVLWSGRIAGRHAAAD